MADFAKLEDCKAALELTGTDKDESLKGLMRRVTSILIDFMNRDPRLADYDDLLSGQGTDVLTPRAFPIVRVYAMAIDGQPVPIDQVEADDHTIAVRNRLFPRGRRNVRVVYSAGLDPLPGSIRQAYLDTVCAIWDARGVNLNATGESWAGVSSESWNQAGVGSIPVAARGFLQRYVSVV